MEFKPCPNCGNTGKEAEVNEVGDLVKALYVEFNGKVRYVKCSECYFKGPNWIDWHDAVVGWNSLNRK